MAHRISIGLIPPFHPAVVVVIVAAYFALHLMQHYALGPELLRFYGKDVLLVPVLASGVAISTGLAGMNIKITFPKLLLTGIYVAVVFEFILPHFGEQYHTDWYDLPAYALGVIIAWLLLWQYRRSSPYGTDFASRHKSTFRARNKN